MTGSIADGPADFRRAAVAALADPALQQALGRNGFAQRRAQAIAALPEYPELRAAAAALKDHVLDHLDHYLERFAAAVEAAGGVVHWCDDAESAVAAVLGVARACGARTATKGKSMAGEEIGLNAALEAAGIRPIETDLGEYIIQLAHEPPSHIIAPASHKSMADVAGLFRAHHRDRPAERPLDQAEILVDEARTILRPAYGVAGLGITGANFLIAESGSAVIVTNEGNGDLTQALAPVHLVVAGIEKLVPRLEDAALLLRLLARSATGQDMTVYTTVASGPRRPADPDGPAAFHVVLIDNGRTALMGDARKAMLRCIRCGACLNHCPVYGQIGGHPYGATYGGPMGQVLTPALAGLGAARDLPQASTFCGRCAEVCPVAIPLPDLMRHWRDEIHQQALDPPRHRLALALWLWLARRPGFYRLAVRAASFGLRALARGGCLTAAPFAGGWTRGRVLPAPTGPSFFTQYRSGGNEP